MIFGQKPCANENLGVRGSGMHTTRRGLIAALASLMVLLIAGCGGGGGGDNNNNGGNGTGNGSGTVQTAVINGRVVDRNSQPVSDAGVAGAQITGAFNATTDASGNFSVKVPAGVSGQLTVTLPSGYYAADTVTLVLGNNDGTTDAKTVVGKTYNLVPIRVYNNAGPPPPPLL